MLFNTCVIECRCKYCTTVSSLPRAVSFGDAGVFAAEEIGLSESIRITTQLVPKEMTTHQSSESIQTYYGTQVSQMSYVSLDSGNENDSGGASPPFYSEVTDVNTRIPNSRQGKLIFVSQTIIDTWSFSILSRGCPQLPSETRDWNQEYQNLINISDSNQYQAESRANAIRELIKEFRQFASKVVDLILHELVLPVEYRTVRPQLQDLKFDKGELRYVYGNCFFKLLRQRDSEDSEFPMKEACNEIRAYCVLVNGFVAAG